MRKLAAAAFSFTGGIFLAQYLLPLRALVPAGLVCAALGLLLRRRSLRVRIFLLSFAAALCYDAAFIALVQAPAEALADTERPGAVMTLCAYPTEAKYGARATVRLHLDGLSDVKAVYYGDESLLELTPGCTVTDRVYLSSAARVRDTDVTSFTSKGIWLLAYHRGTAETGRGSADSVRWWPLRAGRALRGRIGALFPGDAGGFMTAMLTGDKTGLSEGAASDLSEAGLYHVLAISGLHCAFLLALVVFVTGRQRRRLTAAIAIPTLLFYMLLAGCTPSVVRACVMLIFLLLAPLFRREGDPATAMAAALGLILLENPFAAASVSLQLSFAAVAGLLWLAPGIRRLLTGGRKRGRPAEIIVSSLAASLAVTLTSAPLAAVYFGIFWLVMPLSNLLCLWAVSLSFSLGLPAVLLSCLWPPLGLLPALASRGLIRFVLWTVHLLAQLPYHAVYYTNPYLKYWLVFLYVLLGLAWRLGPPARRKYALAAGLAVVTLAVTVRMGQLRAVSGRLDVTALNVGQGQCVLFASDGCFAAADCGSGNSWMDAGGIAADNLAGMGCRELRYLLLTHYDYDHVSGVGELLSRLRVDTLLLPDEQDDAGLRSYVLDAAGRAGTEVRFVRTKETFPLGRTGLTVYPPLGADNDNDRGLSLLCSSGDYDLLLTGDMDAETEQLLLEAYPLPDIEALVVGHHGSRYSTSQALLETLRPELGVISVGSNRFGHPTRQTLRRLTAAGVTICRTDLQGNIHICVK